MRTYTNKRGQQVLKQVYLDSVINGAHVSYLETYYVYDIYGRLTYQVPPKAMAAIGSPSTFSLASNPTTDPLIYKYAYDSLGRLVEKTAPGAAVQYIVYDQLGRVVLTQDGNQRASHQWAFIKYDMLNRPVYSGLYTNTTQTSRKAVQGLFISWVYDISHPYFETPANNATYLGYTNTVFPTTGLTVIKKYTFLIVRHSFIQTGIKSCNAIQKP